MSSHPSRRVSVIVPTLNEGKTIKAVLENISKLDGVEEVIVVDGGSVDGTAELAERSGATVIIERSGGWGNAVRKGLESARGEFLVIVDADYNYSLNAIHKLVNVLIIDQTVAAVVGSRSEKSFANRLISWFFRILFDRPITDVVSSLIATRGEIVRDLELHSTDFALSVEILVRSIKKGHKVVEVPISYRSQIRPSKLRVFRDGLHILREIIRMWLPF